MVVTINCSQQLITLYLSPEETVTQCDCNADLILEKKKKIILKDVLEKMHAVAVLNKILSFIEAGVITFS